MHGRRFIVHITGFCGHQPTYHQRMASFVSQIVMDLMNRGLIEGFISVLNLTYVFEPPLPSIKSSALKTCGLDGSDGARLETVVRYPPNPVESTLIHTIKVPPFSHVCGIVIHALDVSPKSAQPPTTPVPKTLPLYNIIK